MNWWPYITSAMHIGWSINCTMSSFGSVHISRGTLRWTYTTHQHDLENRLKESLFHKLSIYTTIGPNHTVQKIFFVSSFVVEDLPQW